MTTIAWDGQTLAADSQSTRRHTDKEACGKCGEPLKEITAQVTKIEIPRKPILFHGHAVLAWAGSGFAALVDTIGEGLRNGVELTVIGKMLVKYNKGIANPPKASIILITTEDVWRIDFSAINGLSSTILTEVPYAIGTGSKAAMLAMKRLNFTAPSAVAAAIDVDPMSGGEVCYIDCRDDTKARTLQRYTYSESDTAELFDQPEGK